jgi:hypothetical protein
MKQLSSLVILLIAMTFGMARLQNLNAQPDEKILLNVGDTATVTEFRITLVGVNDDGCGRVIECYWIAYRDATFQVERGGDSSEVTLSLASREDSRRFVKVGEYYLILEEALGYDTEIDTAEFYVTKTLEPYLYEWEKTE